MRRRRRAPKALRRSSPVFGCPQVGTWECIHNWRKGLRWQRGKSEIQFRAAIRRGDAETAGECRRRLRWVDYKQDMLDGNLARVIRDRPATINGVRTCHGSEEIGDAWRLLAEAEIRWIQAMIIDEWLHPPDDGPRGPDEAATALTAATAPRIPEAATAPRQLPLHQLAPASPAASSPSPAQAPTPGSSSAAPTGWIIVGAPSAAPTPGSWIIVGAALQTDGAGNAAWIIVGAALQTWIIDGAGNAAWIIVGAALQTWIIEGAGDATTRADEPPR